MVLRAKPARFNRIEMINMSIQPTFGLKSSLITQNIRHFSQNNDKKPEWSPVASDESEAASIQSAKDFVSQTMSEAESMITELKEYSEWQPLVMESKVPVVLDCYAEWCAPCKKLEPVLKDAALSMEGKVKLVKLNVDDLPQLSNGLSVRSLPSVFLIFQGKVVDMFAGLPQQDRLEEFFKTALYLQEAQTDETVIQESFGKVLEMIGKGEYVQALDVVVEGQKLEKWQEMYSTEMILAEAFCKLMKDQDKNGLGVDTISIRSKLETLTEQKINDLSEEFQEIALKVDTELQRIETLSVPDEKEQKLREEYEHFRANPSIKPDLQVIYDLGCHMIAKNRPEEAIDLLLECIAIDRNWNGREPQKQLTDLFKKLGSTNEAVKKGRKTLSALLF